MEFHDFDYDDEYGRGNYTNYKRKNKTNSKREDRILSSLS